ncbi:hypothetical protein BH10PSE19_BH10PSE19_18460 [soil metagenome]
MILESAQILCTVLWQNGVEAPYKKTHINHPCIVWAGESLANWQWLKSLAQELNSEYQYRFNKKTPHKSFEVIMTLPEPDICDRGLTKLPLVMPQIYYDADPIEAYRSYYIHEKTHIAKWTKRKTPKWFVNKNPLAIRVEAT